MQGLLECLDIPYVGPGVLAAALTIDKLIFKRLIREHGIAQVEFCQVGEEDWREQAAALRARLGEAVAARLQRRDPQGRRAGWARRGGRSRAAHDPRVIIEAHCRRHSRSSAR